MKKKPKSPKSKPRGASPFFEKKKSKKAPSRKSSKRDDRPAAATAKTGEAAGTPATPGPSQQLTAPPELTVEQQTILWLLEGHRDHDVEAALKARYPGIDAKKILEKTMEHFAAISEADPRVIRGWCLEAYQELYRRMVSIGDYANALRAVKELHRTAS